MQMRSPESLNQWQSEHTLQIRRRSFGSELWERADLFAASVYLAEIRTMWCNSNTKGWKTHFPLGDFFCSVRRVIHFEEDKSRLHRGR